MSGKKTSTIRLGSRRYPLGPARIVSGKVSIPITITDVEFTTVGGLNEVIAAMEGYNSLDELFRDLKRFYPGAEVDSQVTVVRFQKT
jgi:hypothetical protein